MVLAAGCSGSGGAPGAPGAPAPSNPFVISNPTQGAVEVTTQNAATTTTHRVHTEYQREGEYRLANFHFAHGAGLNGKGTTVSIISGAFNTRNVELIDKTQDAAQGGLTFRSEDRARAFVNIIGNTTNTTNGSPSVHNPFPLGGVNSLEELENIPNISDTVLADFTARVERSVAELEYLEEHNLAFNTEDLPLKGEGTNIAALIAGRDFELDVDGNQTRGDLDISDRNLTPADQPAESVGEDYRFMGVAFGTHLDLFPYLNTNLQWVGFSGIAEATQQAVADANAASRPAVFQANDWAPNRHEFYGTNNQFLARGLTEGGIPTYAAVKARQEAEGETFEQALKHLISCETSTCSGSSFTDSNGEEIQFAPEETLVDGFEDYLGAVREFGKTGIVAFALENNTNYGLQSDDSYSAPIMAALPLEYTDLQDFWLAVGGVDSTAGSSTNTANPPLATIAGRSTSRCADAAAYCLMAPNHYRAVNDEEYLTHLDYYGNNSSIGSSVAHSAFALAAVGAAAALVAEAFPDLSGQELRNRLLASANQDFDFYRDSDSATGLVNFGTDAEPFTRSYTEPYTRSYNEEYGHGVLDVRAALLPIGEQTVQTGTKVNQSTLSLASAQMFTTPAVGNALALSLGNTQLATFDALGAPFPIPAASLIKIDVDDVNSFEDELERFAKAGSFMSSGSGDLTDGWQQAFGGAPLTTLGNGFMLSPENVAIAGNYQPAKSRGGVSVGWRFHSGSTSVMAQGFGLAPVADDVFANSISILPTDGMSYGAVQVGEASSLGAFAFVEDEGGRFESTGFAFARASALPGGGLGTLGLVMKSEDYAFMGLKSGASDTDDFSGLAGALNFSAQWNLSDQVLGKAAKTGSIFFNAEYGMAEGEGAALVQGFDTTTFSGYAVGLRFNEVLNESDTLTVSVRQPLRVESGAANLQLAQGRDVNRNIDYENFAASLSPDARQIDIGARYGWNVDETTRVNIGGYYSMNENHIAGEEGGAVMLAISKKF